MRRHGKKLTALLLALCMALGLAACGGGGEDKKQDEASPLSGTVYVPEFMDLDLDADDITAGCCDGTNIYVVAEKNTEKEAANPFTGETYTAYSSEYCIYKVPLDGSAPVELENYEPSYSFDSSDEGWFTIDSLRAGADGSLWVSERADVYDFDLPENFDPEKDDPYNYLNSTTVELERKLDATGKEIDRVDISTLAEKLETDWIYRKVLDAEGYMYASNNTGVFVLDREMNVLFSITDESWGDLILLTDGSVAMMRYGDEGRSVQVIDRASKGWGKSYPIAEGNPNSIYSGAGEYLFYYESGDSLYGYKAETSSGERLLSWSSADINSDNLVFFNFLSDGRVVAMTQEWGTDGRKVELAVLTEQDASVLADKTVLTYATMYLDQQVRTNIINFNKTNGKYRIEIRDYSEYNTEDDYNAGLTKLNTEIVAGNVPDLMAADMLPLRQYGAQGLLEDLWPYIDNDPEIGRDSLMDRPLKAAEQDGKLYQIFNSFVMYTLVGSRKVVGDDMGWTLDELKAAQETMPEGSSLFGNMGTKEGMLRNVLMMNLDHYVDWEKGECSFDSDGFKGMLEFCSTFPAEYVSSDEEDDEPTRIAEGRQMLNTLSLDGFSDFQVYEAMFGGPEALKQVDDSGYSGSSSGFTTVIIGDSSSGSSGGSSTSSRLIPGRYVTFKGFPMEDGSCGSSFDINGGMAMSSTCKDKEGAWSFMRQLLLPEDEEQPYGYRWGFPINKADFEKAAAKAMEAEYITDSDGKQILDGDGEPIQASKGGWTWGTLDIDLQATTQEEYDQIMELYNAIDSLRGYDQKIADIVIDVAGGYFSGDKTLEDAAAQIQSRVNLYVHETL